MELSSATIDDEPFRSFVFPVVSPALTILAIPFVLGPDAFCLMNNLSSSYLQMLALGNQVGKLYVWDLEVEDPHKAK